MECLPYPGGLLDQPAWFVILAEAVFEGRIKGEGSANRYKSLKTMMQK